MHGVLGVTIGAFITCSKILGQNYLMDKIVESNKNIENNMFDFNS